MKKETTLMAISVALFTVGAYLALVKLPSSPEPILRNNYRIIFFHLPSAITSFTAFTVTLLASIQYLRTRKFGWDILSASSAKAGFVMITAALVSGSIWAKVAWGAYWNWDPRETTVLILWFAYAAYFALRSSVEDVEERAKVSSILAIFCYATVPLSYLSTKLYFSLHPSTQGLKIGLNIGTTLGTMITAFLLLYVAYVLLDTKLSKIEMEVV